jgi:XTP/dITP diphosphohydrolase/tetrapyrrole methylase family protein/MazG family protein
VPADLSAAALGLLEQDRAAAHAERFADFVALVHRLRRDCPWDREQTHDSTAPLTIEEAHEVAEAIDARNPDALKKELGDLMLHVLFHAHIAEGDGTFTLLDVMEAEITKLVRRHPHVFGETAVSGTGEVLQNWEAIKAEERAEAGEKRASALDGVPAALPALLRAQRVQDKAAGVGFDFPEAGDAWEKVEEELAEFRALDPSDQDRREDELGDVLFAIVNYARLTGLTPENALRRTTGKFQRRFAHVEARLAESDRRPSDASLGEMDALWNEAKTMEQAP